MGDTNKKYLDSEGLALYHNELVKRLSNLEYDPERLFENKTELFSKSKWGADKYGRVSGLKKGLIITVGKQLWQLVNPDTFNLILSRVQDVNEKILIPVEDLGWKIISNTVDFDVNGHTLILTK